MLQSFRTLLLTLIMTLSLSFISVAQDSEPPKKEFRGVWIATVINLDWPTSVGIGSNYERFQKQSLVENLDKLKEAGINAVLFQVRSEADAMYDSNYEPWSKYLTREEGVAPDPFWDPLEFAVKEAHNRGMELHAWFNPYRADRNVNASKNVGAYDEGLSSIEQSVMHTAGSVNPDNYVQARADNHVTITHPEWIITIGSIAILNPGIPDVMQYNTNVIMDVVNRYDIDGVHFDDYFYPYSPNTISDEDSETYTEFGGDFDNIGDWRRDNVNTLIEMIHDSIKTVKPHVSFGISPFGRHSEGYNSLYADGYAWMQGEYLDYINPQLYWEETRFNSGADFGFLYAEWAAERNGRHIYSGHGLYRAASQTFGGTLFGSNQVPLQIEVMRNLGVEDSTGSVFFRMQNITDYPTKGIKDSLMNNFYRHAALTPTMNWLSQTEPPTPLNFEVERDTEVQNEVHLSWDAPEFVNGNDTTLKYVIYRAASADGVPAADTVMANAEYAVYITGQTTFTDHAPGAEGDTYYFITAATTNSVESSATEVKSAGTIVSNENIPDNGIPNTVSLRQNYPNPFNPSTSITFELNRAQDVQLNVYNMLGQHVQTLVNADQMRAGAHSVTFEAAGLPSGLYFYRLTTGEAELTKKMTLIK